jgi:tRNA G18 (ribose-2'-O)-methylase SpoU
MQLGPDDVVLDGLHPVKHALRFGASVTRLLTSDRAGVLALAAVVAPDLVDLLASSLEPVDAAALARIGRAEVVGIARRPAERTLGPAPVVLLDDPRQLGNVGAVVRVAAGFGAGGVLTTGSVDPWHPTVVRAAAGLHFALPVRRVGPLPDGRPLLAFDPAGADLRTAELPDDAILAFGSERRGLSAEVRARADRLVAIPMRDRVSSYNLAASVAVALYAWTAAG